VLELGIDQGKEVQFQIDQANDPRESGTETLIDAVSWFGQPTIEGRDKSEPTVWAIHSISPSGYDDVRFEKMVEGMLEHNIGLICCPSAALSMRQLRPMISPIHNSIARVLEMAEAGVRVRVGTDNICDIYIPNSDGNMLTEMKVLGTAVRFYVTNILAKWGAGIPLNEMDRDSIKKALDADQSAFADLKLGK
jgi:hypothetical protein